MKPEIRVRAPEAQDRDEWGGLYAEYAEFYKVAQTEGMRDQVWNWIRDPAHEVLGLVAEDSGRLVGIAHLRSFARPLSATTGGFLDDLFVSPAARGSGVAEALIRAAKKEGQARSWSVIRWITADNNYRARGLYDRLAERTTWVTYDLKP